MLLVTVIVPQILFLPPFYLFLLLNIIFLFVIPPPVRPDWILPTSQKPLMDLKNLQFFLEDRDYSKINLVDLKMSLDPLSTFRSTF